MKVKRMGITEILRKIWLLSANKIKRSESTNSTHRRTQLITAAEIRHNCHHLLQLKKAQSTNSGLWLWGTSIRIKLLVVMYQETGNKKFKKKVLRRMEFTFQRRI